MTTKISANNIQAATLANLGGSPTITQIQVCDSSYTVLDDTAVDTAGGYIKITGTRFASGCQVTVGSTAATSVTFVSSTEIRAQVPATSAGTYIVYVSNTDGSTAIRVNGITFSALPAWTTGSTLPQGASAAPLSIQLAATSATSYALAAGSTLPTGLTLTSGGLLSGTITISAETTYNFSVVATDAELQDSPRTFSITITSGDVNWKSVTTLLSPTLSTQPFNKDASTNNFALKISGNTKPNNFNPYTPTYYSNYFDGTGDGLSFGANANFSFGTGDFTVEFWTNPSTLLSSSNSAPTMVAVHDNASDNGWQLYLNDGYIGIRTYYSNVLYVNEDMTPLKGKWSHIAYVRYNGVQKIYINGVEKCSTSTVWNWTNNTLQVGYTAQDYPGAISNLRIIKGTALYTSAFTPPTQPLTAISGTVVLTCQANRFIDNGPNAYPITVVGGPTIQSANPFMPNSSYVTYGSTYFDGSSALSLATAQTFSGSFTAECWFYRTANPTNYAVIFGGADIGSGTSGNTQLSVTNTGAINTAINAAAVGTSAANVVPLNQWTHIVWVRSGSSFAVFVNGTRVVTATNSGLANIQFVGAGGDGSNAIFGSGYATIGYISDARITNTAVYDPSLTALTIPTSPLTAVSGTSLLTCQTNQPVNNSTFLDNSTNNFQITRNGNATQGTFSPYGESWSNYFSAADARLEVVNSDSLMIAQGTAYTLESWVYITNNTATGNSAATSMPLLCSAVNNASTGNGRSYGFGTSTFGFYDKASATWLTINWTPLKNQWFHLALVSTGSVFTLYINGTSVGSVTDNTTYYADTAYKFYIGSYTGQGTGAGPAPNFYLSNFRYTKAQVYTAAFTPSTTPLQALPDTTVLTCQSNSFADRSAKQYAIALLGATPPTVQKFGPFPGVTLPTPYYSAYFNGSTDYLSVPAIPTLATQFTIEFWANFTNTDGGRFDFFSLGGSAVLYRPASNTLNWYIGSDRISGTFTLAANGNKWNHITICRDASNNTRLFVNGTQLGSTYPNDTNTYSSTGPAIGWNSGGGYLAGHISNFRIISGTALYTSNFTPPTVPLTAVSGTSLLTCQNNTFVDNSSNVYNITAVGSPKPRQISPFTPTYSTGQAYTPAVFGGSAYFDGTGDWLTIPNSSGFAFGSSEFTVELWTYITGTGGTVANYTNGQSTNSNFAWEMYQYSTTEMWFSVFSGMTQYTAKSTAFRTNSWNHIAAVRSGNTLTIYVNGISGATTVSLSGVTISDPASSTIKLCSYGNGSGYTTGYISDFRVVKGTALYTANFVPQNRPLTAVQNTTLLTNMTGAAIYDSSTANVFETVGDAKLSTTTVKYGNTSLYFDGTGDYVKTYATENLRVWWNNSFTLEYWVYVNSFTDSQNASLAVGNMDPITSTNYWSFGPIAAGAVRMYYWNGSAQNLTASTTLSTGQWYHLALVNNAGTISIYVNGTSSATGTVVGTPQSSASYPITIGQANNVGFNGYISDLRITKGLARYTAAFTPPSGAFQAK